MMMKDKLQARVSARKQELEAEHNKLADFREKVGAFVNDIRSRSAVYALVKNLRLWKELEALTDNGSDS